MPARRQEERGAHREHDGPAPALRMPGPQDQSAARKARVVPRLLTPADVTQLQRTTGNAATGRLLQAAARELTVQRTILVHGEAYDARRAAEFKRRYGQDLRLVMNAFSEVERRPRTIDGLLRSRRRFYLNVTSDAYGRDYWGHADPYVHHVWGGRWREADRYPALVTRPAHGREELRVTGLISCVGVFLDAWQGNRGVVAASALHFVPYEGVTEDRQSLTEDAERRLDQQVAMTRRHGAVSAVLYYTGETDRSALRLIEGHLRAKGVRSGEWIRGRNGAAMYSLFSNGTYYVGELDAGIALR